MSPINADIPIHLVLFGILAACCVTDLKSRRIPNIVTGPAMLLGLCYHGMTNGPGGLGFAAAGLALGLAVMIVPFLLGVMGAGDVKLMAAAGAILGPYLVLDAFLATSIFGGLYAAVVLALRRDHLRRILSALWDSLSFFIAFKRFNYVKQDSDSALPRLCYGVAIAAGAATAVALSMNGYGLFAAAAG
jgi:prepilin peptidase CpaA